MQISEAHLERAEKAIRAINSLAQMKRVQNADVPGMKNFDLAYAGIRRAAGSGGEAHQSNQQLGSDQASPKRRRSCRLRA